MINKLDEQEILSLESEICLSRGRMIINEFIQNYYNL